MGNVIIAVILIVVVVLAGKGTIKHLKGEGGCCGDGSSIKEPDKKLTGPVVKTKVFKIDGMHCENCTDRVKRAVNRIDGVSAKVNLRKKEAVIEYERDVDDAKIVNTIESLDYKVVSVSDRP